MICTLCKGSGTLLDTKNGLEFWVCPCCGGSGVRITYGPSFIGPGTRKKILSESKLSINSNEINSE